MIRNESFRRLAVAKIQAFLKNMHTQNSEKITIFRALLIIVSTNDEKTNT